MDTCVYPICYKLHVVKARGAGTGHLLFILEEQTKKHAQFLTVTIAGTSVIRGGIPPNSMLARNRGGSSITCLPYPVPSGVKLWSGLQHRKLAHFTNSVKHE